MTPQMGSTRVLTGTDTAAAAAATITLVAFGDRLGLFRSRAGDGPATSGELAARTGTDER